MADEHGQHVMALASDMIGADAMLTGVTGDGAEAVESEHLTSAVPPRDLRNPSWHYGLMFSPALTIGGGTWAVQRNIIGELVLGLPRDEDVTRGMSWADAQRLQTK